MKKLLLLTTLSAFASLTAFADQITLNCTPFPATFNNGAGSSSLLCPAFAPPPNTVSLDSASLTLYASYQFGNLGTANEILISFGITSPGGVTWANAAPTVDLKGGFTIASTTPSVPLGDNATAGVSLANFASGFNLDVSSSVVAGGVSTSSGGAQITYNYTINTTPPVGTPEPASISLIGLGLVGLGFGARRKS